MLGLAWDKRSWEMNLSFHETREAMWNYIESECYLDEDDEDLQIIFKDFKEENKDSRDFTDDFFGSFTIREIPEKSDEDPHGHIVCVRPSDLEDYFGEDAEYFTQEMLEALSDGIWQMDDDGWASMFDDNLRALMKTDKAAWQKEIDEEKERRRNA